MTESERDRAGELAEAERQVRQLARCRSNGGALVSLLAEYDRRGECLRFLNEKYDIRREQQRRQDETATKLRAALAQAQTVVAAARALVEGWDALPEYWKVELRSKMGFTLGDLAREVHKLDSDGGGSGG